MKSFIKKILVFPIIILIVVFSGGLNLYNQYCACADKHNISLKEQHCCDCDSETENEHNEHNNIDCKSCFYLIETLKTEATIISSPVNIDFSVLFISNILLTNNLLYKFFTSKIYYHKINAYFFGDCLYKYFHQIKVHIS